MRHSASRAEGGDSVDKLKVPLSEIKGRGAAIDATVSAAELEGTGAAGESPREIAVSGTFSAVDSDYLFRGTISGVFKYPCDRCLEESERRLDVEVLWYFEPGPVTESLDDVDGYEEVSGVEENEPIRCFEGNDIDLWPHVLEELTLGAPGKFLCAEDCKGLCPRCGASLNRGPCGCPVENERGNPGFAALADMFPDLPPGTSEE